MLKGEAVIGFFFHTSYLYTSKYTSTLYNNLEEEYQNLSLKLNCVKIFFSLTTLKT